MLHAFFLFRLGYLHVEKIALWPNSRTYRLTSCDEMFEKTCLCLQSTFLYSRTSIFKNTNFFLKKDLKKKNHEFLAHFSTVLMLNCQLTNSRFNCIHPYQQRRGKYYTVNPWFRSSVKCVLKISKSRNFGKKISQSKTIFQVLCPHCGLFKKRA